MQLFNVKFDEPCRIYNKLFETKVNVFLALNTAGKRSFFNVTGLLDSSLDCDDFTLCHVKTSQFVPAKKDN